MGTPGSPLTRFTVVLDKWVRPNRRLADLTVGPTDLICDPEDLLEDSLDVLIVFFRVTWRVRQDIKMLVVPSDSPKITGLCCNLLEIGFPVVTDLDSGPQTLSVSQYEVGKGVLQRTTDNSSKAIQSRTRRRVLLSGGLNQYKLTVSFVLRVPLHNHHILSSRSPPTPHSLSNK
jgi:hypothetical protein